MVVNVVVLGAGVVGLSTALNVQQVVPGARVTVMADKFYEQTTSYGSGGMFIPSLRAFPNTDVGLLRWPLTAQYRICLGRNLAAGYFWPMCSFPPPEHNPEIQGQSHCVNMKTLYQNE